MTAPDARPGRARLRDATVARLQAALPELAGRIHTGRTWPVQSEDLPRLLVYMVSERKRRFDNTGPPSFRVTASLVLQIKVDAANEVALEAEMDRLDGLVETALLNNAEWVDLFENILNWDTQYAAEPGGERPEGQVSIVAELQWTEQFDPILDTELGVTRLHLDLAEPFDRTGTYDPPAGFPAAAAAPRDAGPDGRMEAVLEIDARTLRPD